MKNEPEDKLLGWFGKIDQWLLKGTLVLLLGMHLGKMVWAEAESFVKHPQPNDGLSSAPSMVATPAPKTGGVTVGTGGGFNLSSVEGTNGVGNKP